MAEQRRLVLAHRSIFLRLVAIMAAMAASILILVAGFFTHVVSPRVDTALERVLEAYAEQVAAQSPDREAATAIARRLGLTIAYQGHHEQWSTGPTPAPSTAWLPGESWSHAQHVVASPAGGRYRFSWDLALLLRAAHSTVLVLLLLLIAGVILLGYGVLRRALGPVRLLLAGVERIGAGDLDVSIPRQSQDELGALTEAFNKMARRVKEMLQLRDQLLLDVSHELRSPLTRVKVALALLPEGNERKRIESDVVQMETMITSILELERLSDARGLNVESLDLVTLLLQVADPFRETSPGLRLALPPPPLCLDGDGERLRTLFRNILENAAKYSLADSRPTQITLEPGPDDLVVTLRDNGQGISDQDLDSVFEPFHRVDRSRSKKTGGYGLGLSICRRIVQAHGGEIHAEHSLDRGVTIVVRLPRRGEGGRANHDSGDLDEGGGGEVASLTDGARTTLRTLPWACGRRRPLGVQV